MHRLKRGVYLAALVATILVTAPRTEAQFRFVDTQARVGEVYTTLLTGGLPNSLFFIAMDTDPGPFTFSDVGLTIDLGLSSNFVTFPLSFVGPAGDTYFNIVANNPAVTAVAFYMQAYNFTPFDPYNITPSNQKEVMFHPMSLGSGVVDDLGLSDDGSALVPLAFDFPFYGQSYTEMYVNANGNISFGSPNSSSLIDENAFAGGPPTIAPFFADFDPTQVPGTVETDTTMFDTTAVTVHFRDLVEKNQGGTSTASVTLTAGGHITIDYGETLISSAITGITPGGGAGLNNVNLSAPGFEGYAAPSPIYEVFGGGSPFDLAQQIVTFVRIQDLGYVAYY